MKKQCIFYFLLCTPFIFQAQSSSSWHFTTQGGYLLVSGLQDQNHSGSTQTVSGWTSNIGVGRAWQLGTKSKLGWRVLCQYQETRRNHYLIFEDQIYIPSSTNPSNTIILNDSTYNKNNRNTITTWQLAIPIYYQHEIGKFNIGAGIQTQLPLSEVFFEELELGSYLEVAYHLKTKWAIQASLYASLVERSDAYTRSVQSMLGVVYYLNAE